jgi:hypothetical protein
MRRCAQADTDACVVNGGFTRPCVGPPCGGTAGTGGHC